MDPPGDQREPLPSRELAAFLAAVDTGGIGAAADSLCLTQSAVTKRIQNLEQRVGATLLDRSHNGVRPTQVGRALYPHATEALRALTQASAALKRARTRDERRLRLAASRTIGTFLLPHWLKSFRATGPAPAQVSVVNTGEVLAAVDDRQVDIGFLPDPTPLDHVDALEVGRDELVVVVGRQHRWARAHNITPSELSCEPFFTREQGSGTRAASLASLRDLGVELEPELETSSTEALKQALLKGGFTIVSSLAIEDEVIGKQLHTVQIAGARLQRRLFALKRNDYQMGHAPQRFWSWLETAST